MSLFYDLSPQQASGFIGELLPSGQECVVARSATKPGGLGACPHSRTSRGQMRSEAPICDIEDERNRLGLYITKLAS